MPRNAPQDPGASWVDPEPEDLATRRFFDFADTADDRSRTFRVRRRAAFALGAAGVIALSGAAVVSRADGVERSLRRRSVARLQQLGYGELAVMVAFDGQDGEITGEVPSEGLRQKLRAEVASVEGVRVVRNRLKVVPGSDAVRPVSLPALSASLTGGRIILRGAVSSAEARDVLVDRASAAVAGDSVSAVLDELTVSSSAAAADLSSIRRFGNFIAKLPALGADTVLVQTNGRTLILKGRAASPAARAEILKVAAGLVGASGTVDGAGLEPIDEISTTTIQLDLGPSRTTGSASTAVPAGSAPARAASTTAAPASAATTTPATRSSRTLVSTTRSPTPATTLVPPTLVPTTLVPPTLVPTTLVPPTLVPTTLVPTTLVPTTLVPTTLVPTTLVPTTLVPTTLVPTTTGPSSAAATAATELRAVLRTARIEFSPDSADLTPGATQIIDELAEVLKVAPTVLITVEGHTDSNGEAATNLLLSQRRADRVREALVAAGVSAVQIKAIGYGATRPLVSNASLDGRSKNRRIDIKVS